MSAKPKPLDSRTLRYVARWHGRKAREADKRDLHCVCVGHTHAARHWSAEARAIDQKKATGKR